MTKSTKRKGISVERMFSTEGIHPYDELDWELRDVEQKNWKTGEVVFEQKGVEFPTNWSINASTIVATKYFRGNLNTPQREFSLKQVIDRVAETYSEAGFRFRYFSTKKDSKVFEDELKWLLVNQYFAFNSPVWFNVGTKSPQFVSACFILGIEDNMDSILNWYREEGLIFKGGSGAGVNLSNIRSSKELLSSGGTASGPVSFMRGADSSAGAIKSGGTCLAPWTQVYTAESGPVEVSELAKSGEKFTTVSYNPILGRMQATRARAWESGFKKLVKLKTDKGEFTLSYDHPVMLMSGGYMPVGELQEGMSIRPGNITINSLGYSRVGLQDGKKSKESIHRLIAKDVLGWDVEGKEVHHKDKNPSNNSPDNLELISVSDHKRLHALGDMEEGIHPFLGFHGKGNHPQVAGEKNGMSFASGNRTEEYRQNMIAGMHREDVYRVGQKASATQRMLNKAYEIVNSGGSIDTFEDYFKGRKKLAGKMGYSKSSQLEKIESRFGSYDSFKEEVRANNHRVVSVSEMYDSVVYDVEVESDTPEDRSNRDGHNFMIISETNAQKGFTGIMVHNTRRAAKMVVLDVDHPDIEEFVQTKAKEERKIRVLRDAGFNMDLDGDDISSVQFQNANNSVRVDDEFMQAVLQDKEYGLIARTTGDVVEKVKAKGLFRDIAQAAWECADPGIQYKSTINKWHTNKTTGPITASNPCFTGETLVAVADGRNAVRIDQLAAEGKSVDVYSKDAKGKTVIRKMKDIRLTRKSAEIVRVALDDGSYVDATPDHLFMLRDGSYVAAKDLKEGMSLKRFDSEVSVYGGGKSGSLRRRVSGLRGWNWQHHLIAERKFGQYRDGKGSFHLDHIDEDSLNDSPDNLRVISAKEHDSISAQKNMVGDRNPARRMMREDWKKNISKALSGEGNPRFIEVDERTLAEVYRDAVIDDPKKGSRREHKAWNEYIISNGLKGTVPLANGHGRIRGMEWEEFVESIQGVGVNHKVVSVVPHGFADVFDGEVEETHNFAVITSGGSDARLDTMSGVFVHNCSEYLSIDNSSCNLASLNLMKFLLDDGSFDIEGFVRAVEIVFTAMDISISFADFPTEMIGKNTRDFRQLGIGYANLGALLMATGKGYDTPEGLSTAAAITSLMTSVAYRRSAELAGVVGPYKGYAENAQDHNQVIEMHKEANDGSAFTTLRDDEGIHRMAAKEWEDAVSLGKKHGYRNAQASLLAPTGTIGFMMDCDTTGIEPDFSLVKFKKLVGGGSMQIVNQTVPLALQRLGYSESETEAIVNFIAENGHVIGAPSLDEQHYPVFDTAMGERAIEPMGHVRMMAAVQPFLSGAISKTVNMPESATVEEIEDVYMQGWKLGLKALAVYRDNCKVGQPLSDGKAKKEQESEVEKVIVHEPRRTRMPRSRDGKTTSFSIGGSEGYITSNAYEDGRIGEIFVKLGKQGSTLSGVMDAFSIAVSIGLQYGVPLDTFVRKFANLKFEPAGMTDDPDIRISQSLMDYIFRRLALDYLNFDIREGLGIYSASERVAQVEAEEQAPRSPQSVPEATEEVKPSNTSDLMEKISGIAVDAPLCFSCGTKMRPSGSCYVCEDCGSTSGCS